jgi:[acyl-carrier-protein] S-malonyltransferase
MVKMNMSDGTIQNCLIFPGQAAHDYSAMQIIAKLPFFKEKYQLVCDLLRHNVLEEIEQNNLKFLRQNLVSSMLTVMASCVLFERYINDSKILPSFYGGYSVGQWTALYASEVLSYETLMYIIEVRAGFMDSCLQNHDTGMIAVIGLSQTALEELCNKLRCKHHFLCISNYNCPGQFTLSGTTKAITHAMPYLSAMNPKKLLRLPVAGAWHCSLLTDAGNEFAHFLKTIYLNKSKIPVLDNVTGDFLPQKQEDLKKQLSLHLFSPVLWMQGVKTIIECGGNRFIEIGLSNTLTKFGFFVNRKVLHIHYPII